MFNAKKYLKIRKLEMILFGGPEVPELNYEKEASYIGDASSRVRKSYGIENHDKKTDFSEDFSEEKISLEDSNGWYEYEYIEEKNQINFKLFSEC